jgi:gamma-glutamylcyclotransferase (GGCT)/AIG2-like uncharacterized protein YtfP
MVHDLLAVYGTLRRRDLWRKLPRTAPKLHFLGPGLIRGRLFWQGHFPALVRECGVTNVEVHQVIDPAVWLDLDAYEGFCPEHRSSSVFRREPARLFLSGLRVWVYTLNPAIPKGTELASRPINNLAFVVIKMGRGRKPGYSRDRTPARIYRRNAAQRGSGRLASVRNAGYG